MSLKRVGFKLVVKFFGLEFIIITAGNEKFADIQTKVAFGRITFGSLRIAQI
jgi:hypothetical protein